MGCCTAVEGETEPFKKVSQRCCTDVFCLVIFLAYTIAVVVIGVVALNQGDINYLLYPQDYKGQFCGFSNGTKTKTKAFYPRLDQDLLAQKSIIMSPVGFLKFTPYTLCVEECPKAFTLASPTKYGGPSYPSAAADAPSFYASLKTQELFSRCLPTTETGLSKQRELCTLPPCGDVSLSDLGAESACTTIDSQPTVTTAWEVTTRAGALACQYQVQEVVRSTFLPEGSDAESRVLEKQFADYVTRAFSVIKSLSSNYVPILVMGVGAPFALALIWFMLLYCFAGVVVVAALVGLLLVMVAGTAYLYYKAGLVDKTGVDLNSLYNLSAVTTIAGAPENPGIGSTAYSIFAVLASVATVIYCVLLVLWRNAIFRCITIVREVTKVIFALPFIIFWPLVGILFIALIAVYFVVVGGYISTMDRTTFAQMDALLRSNNASILAEASSGEAAARAAVADALTPLTSMGGETQVIIMLAVHVVGVIWAYWITELAVYTTLARACSIWYYSHGPSEGDPGEIVQKGAFKLGVPAVVVSAWCVFSRHLGSVAFAAAILTIFTIIRTVLEAAAYVAEQKNPNNMLLKMAIKCTKCFVWCLEKTVQMVTYFGMIFVAIEGSNFCKACFSTFKCWSHYPAQVAVNKLVARVLSLVISLSIPAGCGFVAYIWVDQQRGYEPLYAAICAGVMAYAIASCVTDVFRCAIDTIFICVFYDLEKPGGPVHMSKSLQVGFDVDQAKLKTDRRATVQKDKAGAKGKDKAGAGTSSKGNEGVEYSRA